MLTNGKIKYAKEVRVVDGVKGKDKGSIRLQDFARLSIIIWDHDHQNFQVEMCLVQ